MSTHMNPRRLRGAVAIRANGDDMASLFAELNTDFAEFKASMEARDKERQKKFEDVVTTEKIDRLEASIGEIPIRPRSTS